MSYYQHTYCLERNVYCSLCYAGGALISELAKKVKWAATTHGCSVVTTNYLEGSGKPVGGLSWVRGPHYRLLLRAKEQQYNESVYIGSLQSATFIRPDVNTSTAEFIVSTGGASEVREPVS